jgi:AraC-like DNA-binding protein
MSFSYEDRLADTPFAQTVWHTQSEGDDCYIASADSSWDMLVLGYESRKNLFVTGPNTKATPILYKEGMEKLGIRFKVGTFMAQLPLYTLVNSMTTLPNATHSSFWLGDVAWQFPNFDDADLFIERLEHHGLITRDPFIEAIVENREPFVPKRSVQRRFLRTTGLSHKSICQIERARVASERLERGVSIQDTIYELGYTDQPHLTKVLKCFTGRTPAQFLKSGKPY